MHVEQQQPSACPGTFGYISRHSYHRFLHLHEQNTPEMRLPGVTKQAVRVGLFKTDLTGVNKT